jgi:hypothetical protein
MNCQRNVNSILPIFFSPIRTKWRLVIVQDVLNSGIGKVPAIDLIVCRRSQKYGFFCFVFTQYLCQTFRYLSEVKLTEGVSVGPDIRKLMKIDVFESKMKKRLGNPLKKLSRNIPGNHKI